MTEYEKPGLGKLDDKDLENVTGGGWLCVGGGDVTTSCAGGGANAGSGACGGGGSAQNCYTGDWPARQCGPGTNTDR